MSDRANQGAWHVVNYHQRLLTRRDMSASPHDVERLFLQAVLSRGALSGSLAQTLWEKSVDIVNGKLFKFHLQLFLNPYS